MTEAEALALLKTFTDWTADPVLSSDELAAALTAYRVLDADGLAPEDDDYTPTYDRRAVYQAAAESWTLKAGKAAGRYAISDSNQRLERQQVVAHCERMAKRYRARVHASLPVASAYGDVTVVDEVLA